MPMQTIRKMANYSPQVDEPASFVDGPPPAYTKGYSVRIQLIRLAATTGVCMVALIGAFVLLAAYLHTSASCTCSPEIDSRFDADPLIAEPSHEVKLQIGENLKCYFTFGSEEVKSRKSIVSENKGILFGIEHKGKSHLDCLVERREQSLNAVPPKGNQRLLVKGEETVISCNMPKGKRSRRSPVCDCSCAC